MLNYIINRVIKEADFIIETGSTVRDTAKRFGVSKSTVHKDVTERLAKIDECAYLQVKGVLECNLAQRHLRGGMATKRKYELHLGTSR
jgi:putative DeoR family transcriptional regulator (stage III sporulation protein D)